MPRKIKGKPNYFGKQLTELHKTIGYTQQQPDDYPFYESKSQYPPVNLLVDLTKEWKLNNLYKWRSDLVRIRSF